MTSDINKAAVDRKIQSCVDKICGRVSVCDFTRSIIKEEVTAALTPDPVQEKGEATYWKPGNKIRPIVKYKGMAWPQLSEKNAHEIIKAINRPVTVVKFVSAQQGLITLETEYGHKFQIACPSNLWYSTHPQGYLSAAKPEVKIPDIKSVDRLHNLIENLARDYKGYLPDIERAFSPVDSVDIPETKRRLAFIEDSLKKADDICKAQNVLYSVAKPDAALEAAINRYQWQGKGLNGTCATVDDIELFYEVACKYAALINSEAG